MNTITAFTPADLISLHHGQPMTTSLQVAEVFGKQHKNVLRKLETLGCSKEFTELNFELCYKNNELQNGKPLPFYNMTKNGFIFLVMGFTGKLAAQFKERYIAAFDWMADQLTHQQAKLPHYNFPAETADPHDRQFQNAWMTPKVILDERNRAPELELLEALQQDGYDVAGAKIRIHAMYSIVKEYLEMQKELAIACNRMASVQDIIKNLTQERGANVSFGGITAGKPYGGHSPRALPRR